MSAPFFSASGGLPSQRSDTGMSRCSRRRDGCVAACLPRVRQPAMPAFRKGLKGTGDGKRATVAVTVAYASTLTVSLGSVIDVRRGRCLRTSSGK